MKVPIYDQQQVAPQAAPGVRTQALVDPAAGAVGQGLQQLGEGVEKASDSLDHVAARADAIWAANAHTSYMHDGTTVLDGNQGGTASQAAGDAAFDGSDNDVGHAPPTGPSSAATGAASDPSAGVSAKGLLNEEGMAAAKYSHPTYDWLAKRKDEIAEAAPNGRAKQLFLESANNQLESYRATIEGHVAQQNRVAGEQALQARSAVGLAAIGKDVSAPGVTDGNILYSLDANVDEVARTIRAIHPGELGDEQAAAYKQKASEVVLQHYIDGKDARGARNFFDQRRQDLGDKADELGKTVQALGDQQAAVQVAGAIIDSAKRPDGTYDMAAIDQQTLALPPEKRTDLVIREVASRRALAGQNNGGMTSNYFNDALSDYQKNFNLNEIKPATATWLQQSDPKGWKAILDEDRQHQDRTRARAPAETPEQLGTYYELKDTYRELSPDELAKLKPQAVVHDALAAGVSLKRASELADQVVQLRGQAPASDNALTKSQGDLVMDALEETGHTELRHGVLRIKRGDEQLRSKLEHEILKHQASLRGASSGKDKGYTLDGDDLQKFLGPMLAPVVTEKNLIFPDKTAPAVAAPGYQSQAIPAKDADQIRSALQHGGRDATPDAIQEVWRAHHGGAPQPQAEPAGPTKVEDLAKDPQALSNLHPAAQQAVKRLAPKLIVLPAMTITASPPKAKAKSETLADTVKGMGVDAGSLDEALKGAK